MDTTRQQRLAEFVQWTSQHIRGDEKGEAHIFLDHLFREFGQLGSLDVGSQPEYRIRKAKEDGGGTAFADYVWKPVVLIEMKKRGQNLAKQLSAGVRLLGPARAEPPQVRRALQLRRVLGLRLRQCTD